MAHIIAKRVMEEIRFRNDIVDVVGSYFTLKRAGSTFKALCPFHKEKTPSFTVNQKRQIFHCFGCGAGGDVFSFVMQHEGVDFMTALQMLADRAGMEVEFEEGEGGEASEKRKLYEIHSELAQFYRRCLLETKGGEKAQRYLTQRKLPQDIAETFLIGYAPARWDAMLQWAEKHKVGAETLEHAGMLIKPSEPNPRRPYYDRFRDRVMFPIQDEQGRVIGFSGRALEEGPRIAKYVNSPETLLFKKSRVLFALDKARKTIVDKTEALVCEGQIDVIRCHQHGFTHAVASQGTAFTEDHARILRRYADSICLVFDPDTAGENAATRTAGVFIDAGLAVRVAVLPHGEDPDSFLLKKGTEAFQALIDKAESAVAFQIRVLSSRENARSEVGVMRIAKALLETIAHSPNAVQRAALVQEAAERLRLPPSALLDDLRHHMRRRQPSASSVLSGEAEETSTEEKMPREEMELCEHLIHVADHPELADLIAKYLPPRLLRDPLCAKVAECALESRKQGKDIQALVAERADGKGGLQRFAAQLLMAPSKIRGEEVGRDDAVKELILYIWRQSLKRERAEVERKLTEPEGKDDPDLRMRSTQIRRDLKTLANWEEGSALIEIGLLE